MILANLDCEVEWAAAPPLPAHVRARLAALGTLLRVLDPEVRLLGPVDRVRIPDIPGTRYAREAGVGSAPPAGDDLGTVYRAWGATAALPGSGDVAIARACNDRRLAASLGDPEDATVVTSVEAIQAIAAAGPWVAKATICAAGRDRVRRRAGALDEATRTRLARLLARDGALVVEPWRDRVLDLGQPGRVAPDGAVTLTPPHRLHVDPGGGFAGVTIGADPAIAPHAEALAAAGRRAGEALAARGYRGPFVVDAFVHHDRGAPRLRALVEINARLTFGWIARAWAGVLGDGTLTLGRGAPPAGAIPLLYPGDGDDTAAWFTASPR